MFTGLIQRVGVVAARRESTAGARIEIDTLGWGHTPRRGDSIAVSGCCLTVAEDPASHGGRLAFDVVPQSLRLTTIGRLEQGSRVNLEHSATPQTLLGGHIVQGHVDGLGEVLRVLRPQDPGSGGEWRTRVGVPGDLIEYMTPKGSVALEGVSLTLAEVDPGEAWFEVALIPTTLEETTLGELAPGDPVNIEADTIAKTVVHHLRHFAAGGR